MNHLKKINKLHNQYYVLRHGESTANQQGLIVSSPENGIKDYGLSDTGKKQVEASVKANQKLKNVTHVICSDFLRTVETATIAHQLLPVETEVNFSIKLRERFFGDYELENNHFYQTVWDDDALDSSHTKHKVESADAVMERTTELIMNLENEYQWETFLLVSHGDALQILQTAFDKKPASKHRSLTDLQTAEIRELVLGC